MLLETARELIVREGEAALTLSAVADEAGLAHATVYGYFSGKRDLLAALGPIQAPPESDAAAAEQVDEHAVAGVMDRKPSLAPLTYQPAPPTEETLDSAEPEPVLAPETAPSIEAVAAEESPAASRPPVQVDPLESYEALISQAEAASELTAETPHSERDDIEEPPTVAPLGGESEAQQFVPLESEPRQQVSHLDEIARRLILPENALKQGTDALISRLEIRLKVLERAIAGVEARQNTITNETDRKIKPVSELVSRLQTRADDAEDRLRQALAELRLHIHELRARQDRLEQNGSGGGTQVAAGEVPARPEPLVSFPPEETEPEAEEPHDVSQGGAPNANSRQSYLSAVRNSAKEGARQAAERESLQEEEKDARRRRFLTAAGIAIVCLAVAGLLYRFHPGAHGVSTAQSKAFEPREVPHKLHALVPRTPLDRLTELANKGDARAELVVGLKYLKGDGVAANDAEAARWLARAARAGDPIAENHLGALYQTGRGVKPDIAQATRWYEAAAAQGDRHAMSNLAVLYAGGAGAPANFAEAARWFQRSASLGYVDAQFNLAVLFERGDGVPQSLLDAYKWYSIAAAAGDAVAKTRANAIATQVSPEELQAAQQAITRFKPEPVNQAANDVPTMAQVLAAR